VTHTKSIINLLTVKWGGGTDYRINPCPSVYLNDKYKESKWIKQIKLYLTQIFHGDVIHYFDSFFYVNKCKRYI